MPCRLICLRGALEGAIFDLPPHSLETEINSWTIGRGASNRIELPDLQASRKHAVCYPVKDGWEVKDLESTNGTMVNGSRIGSRRLESGDHLQICGTVFLYLDGALEGPNEVLVDACEWSLTSTSRAQGLESWGDQLRLPRDSRNHLGAMLDIASAMKEWQSLEGLQQNLLRLVLEWVPAERGAVLALDPDSGEVGVNYGRRRSNGTAAVAVSRSVLEQVRRDRKALLGHFDNGGLPASQSILSAGIRSLIAAPMVERGQVTGVLYLDTLSDAQPLTEESLQFAAAAAAMAAQPLENARRIDQLDCEKRRLESDLGRDFDMIGDSLPMRRVYQALSRVATSDSTVLILGETGSGKELAARAIHARGRRSRGPFVAINCAAIAENLLETELFGHERGAFTGAFAQKRGKIELAEGGTLFLDEIGELPQMLQAKLLRVLEQREFERVGGTRPIRVNLRLAAATHRDLPALVAEGRFRGDLYYRLNVVSLRLPPLRERPSDILMLAVFFLERLAAQVPRPVRGFSPEARTALLSYQWPGNVRELRNVIERALVLGYGEWIEKDDLPDEVVEAQPSMGGNDTSYHALVLATKRRILDAALEKAQGCYIEAARDLGIHVKHLHRLMRSYGLKGN